MVYEDVFICRRVIAGLTGVSDPTHVFKDHPVAMQTCERVYPSVKLLASHHGDKTDGNILQVTRRVLEMYGFNLSWEDVDGGVRNLMLETNPIIKALADRSNFFADHRRNTN